MSALASGTCFPPAGIALTWGVAGETRDFGPLGWADKNVLFIKSWSFCWQQM